MPYDCVAIYVQQNNRLKAAYVQGENSRLFSSLEIPLGQGLSGWVLENNKPIVNGNPGVEPGYLNDAAKFTTLCSALAMRNVPIRTIQELAGHASITTTMRYMHLTATAADEAIRVLEAKPVPSKKAEGE